MNDQSDHKSCTTNCDVHDKYLEALTEADGFGWGLPEPAECEVCQGNYERFVATRELLLQREAADDAFLSDDWQAQVWIRLAESSKSNVLPFPGNEETQTPAENKPRWKVWNHLWWAVAACLAGASFAGVLVAADPGPAPVEPLPAARQAKAAPPQVGLRAYALSVDSVSSLEKGARVARGDQLSFDYLNAPGGVGDAMRYLTVVARVEQGGDAEVRWLVDSQAIGPTQRRELREINTDVPIDAPPGEMTIIGLFSQKPLAPKDIEDAVLNRKGLPGVVVSRLDVTVE